MEPKQFTLKLPYRVGELSKVTRVLAHYGVNILGIFAREIEEFALVRVVVDDAVKAERLFREYNISYEHSPGILVILKHEPGALHVVTDRLAAKGIGIIYLYVVVLTAGKLGVAFKLDDLEGGLRELKEAGLEIHSI